MQPELLDIYQGLDPAGQDQLLCFAQFLQQRSQRGKSAQMACTVAQTPLPIERPAKESVVAAMRRLSQTYPMLDKDALLNKAASLMSSHVLQGRPANEVIDDLEALFLHNYTAHRATPEEPVCD